MGVTGTNTGRRRRGAALLSCIVLAACGGTDLGGDATQPGGDGGDAAPPADAPDTGGGGRLAITVTPDGRILAGRDPIVPGDFAGRTFPARVAVLLDGAPQAGTATGTGTVAVVDADTLIVTLPGRSPVTLSRSGPATFGDGTRTYTLDEVGAARYLVLSGGAPGEGVLASFGFETPVASRPVVASYGGTSSSSVFLVPDGAAAGFRVDGRGSVNLLAVFSGSGGTLTGTLLDGRATVDFDADGVANDDLALRTTLDGTITEGGFTGTVRGSASVGIAGGPAQDLALSLGASAAAGSFFGPAAEVASGTYGAGLTFTPPGGPARSGRLSGFFVATTR